MQKLMKTIRVSILYAAALLFATGYPLTTMAEGTDTTTIPSEVVPVAPPDGTTAAVSTTITTTPPASSPETDTTTTPPAVAATDTGSTSTTQSAKTDPTTAVPAATNSVVEPQIVTPNPTTTTTPTDQSTANATLNDTTKTAIANALSSTATSGDATVKDNTTAGSATSGNASAAQTIINNVNSSMSNANNQKAATFTTNVMGDVNGDVILQPMLLKAMLEANQPAASNSTINVTNTNQLTNTINLQATSGNATVADNTTAGNATTGSANTVANVVNIVNSLVGANQSFVGTVNIYGNLNGDILIAPDFISQLLASNAAAPALQQTPSSTVTVSSSDTQSIVNNVSLAAASGQAKVLDNTTAGNATSGDASTNVVIFNLSGHAIVASNSLLVFVNVLGKWVGVIVDAPTGTTAAAIGNGVTSNTVSPDLVIAANNTALVTNNINLSSQSGNALVADNITAGNATSGNATASVNIANITGSQLGLSGWFGILFINVFGTWYGSFGLDTPYGNPLTGTTTPPYINQPPQVIAFRPHTNTTQPLIPFQPAVVPIIVSTPDGSTTADTQSAVLAAATEPTSHSVVHAAALPETPSLDMRLPIVAGVLGLLGFVYVGLRRFFRG